MSLSSELDRLLVTLDVDVQTLAFCELRRGRRLVAPAVDAIMIHYVLVGTMHMEVPGSEPIVCSPGSIALIPPSVSVRVAADVESSCDIVATEHCVVGHDGVIVCDLADGGPGDLRYVSGVVLASFSGSFGLFDRLDRPIVQQLGGNETVQHAYKVMLDEMTRSSVGAKALTSALMKACLVILIRESIAGAGPGGSLLQSLPDPRFSKAIAAVLDRPAEDHSVGSMALSAGMSRSAFSRHFHIAFGMSPIAFVSKTRLYHAAQLLRSTPLPIKVIAGAAGFASRSHFSRAFKAAYGTGPSGFRERHGNEAIDPPRRVASVGVASASSKTR